MDDKANYLFICKLIELDMENLVSTPQKKKKIKFLQQNASITNYRDVSCRYLFIYLFIYDISNYIFIYLYGLVFIRE